eukprot:3470178-Amphidinium_carterae.2
MSCDRSSRTIQRHKRQHSSHNSLILGAKLVAYFYLLSAEMTPKRPQDDRFNGFVRSLSSAKGRTLRLRRFNRDQFRFPMLVAHPRTTI